MQHPLGRRFVALVAAVVAVAVAVTCQEAPAGEFAVDIVTQHGNHVQFPFFSPQVRQIDPKLREMLIEDMDAMIAEFSATLNKRLTAKAGCFGFIKGSYDWSVLGAKLYKMDRAQEARKKELKVGRIETKGAFSKAMQAMFKRMVEMAKEEAAKLKDEPRDVEKLAKEIRIYMDDLREAIASSVVAGYFDWSNGVVNGESYMSYSARIMGRMSNHGYSGVFSCVSGLLDMTVRMQG